MIKDIDKMRREVYDYYELLWLDIKPDLPSIDKDFPKFKLEGNNILWKRDIYNLRDIEGMSYFNGELVGREKKVVNNQSFDILIASDTEGIKTFEEYSGLLLKPFLVFSDGLIVLDKYHGLPETEKRINKHTDLCSRLFNIKDK